jgi:hypothetical protein
MLLLQKIANYLQGDCYISANMLDNFMLSIVSVRGNYKALHLVQGGARHILRFLFARGVTTILLVGGLGVDDDQDDQGGLGVEDNHHKIISFCGVGLKRGFFIKTKNAW